MLPKSFVSLFHTQEVIEVWVMPDQVSSGINNLFGGLHGLLLRGKGGWIGSGMSKGTGAMINGHQLKNLSTSR